MGTMRQDTGQTPNYEGKYVAIQTGGGHKIIASGRKVGPVIDEARKQGENIPTVVFVPRRDGAYYY